MAHRRRILTIGVAVSMLAGCTAELPDLDAAQRDAEAFTAAAALRADALAILSLTAYRDAAHSGVDMDEYGGGTIVEFASDVTLHEVNVACFGVGEMQVGLAIRKASSWSGAESDPTTVECTGEPVSLNLRPDLDAVNAASFRATLTAGSAAVAALALFGDELD
jgi:hypothetical protein